MKRLLHRLNLILIAIFFLAPLLHPRNVEAFCVAGYGTTCTTNVSTLPAEAQSPEATTLQAPAAAATPTQQWSSNLQINTSGSQGTVIPTAQTTGTAVNTGLDTSGNAGTIIPQSSGTVNSNGYQVTTGLNSGLGTACNGQPYSNNGNIVYCPLEPIPGLDESGNTPFGTLLSGLFKILITIGSLITIGTFVYAGIVYMTSAVVGNKKDATNRMKASVLGLFVLISSWLILNTINPQLVTFGAGSLNLNPTQSLSPVTPVNTPATFMPTTCSGLDPKCVPSA